MLSLFPIYRYLQPVAKYHKIYLPSEVNPVNGQATLEAIAITIISINPALISKSHRESQPGDIKFLYSKLVLNGPESLIAFPTIQGHYSSNPSATIHQRAKFSRAPELNGRISKCSNLTIPSLPLENLSRVGSTL